MDNLFKYFGYAFISLLLGFISTLGNSDYLQTIKPSIIPVLLTLTVLHTTLTGALLNELIKYSKEHTNAKISSVIESMKRSAIIEISIISATFLIFIIKDPLINYITCITKSATIIENSIIVFAFMYFILVLQDAIRGWYKLMSENNK